MGNKVGIRYVFASSNTSQGFYTFIPELIKGLGKVYILKGAPGSGRATFIKLLGESLAEQGYEIEYWISAMDPVNPDGLFIPQLDAAVINGSLPEPVDPRYPGVSGCIINLGDYWDNDIIREKSEAIIDLADKVENQKVKVYNILKNAAQVKEEVKKIVTGHLNIEKIQELIDELSAQIISKQTGEKHFFASAFTAEGIVNYLDELSAGCRKRFIFTGPPGSGKSTVISEVARRAANRGYQVEYYHCGLEPDNISMVIIPELDLALIDAGSKKMLVKPWDRIIDMGTYLDEYHEDGLAEKANEVCRMYETLIEEAQNELKNTTQTLRELKKIYSSSMDFEQLDKRRYQIWQEITR